MSRRRALQQRVELFHDLSDILGAMKNLALMETRKLHRYQETQLDLVRHMEQVAGDFFHHHPAFRLPADDGPELIVLVGAERGFCGDFNTALVHALERYTAQRPGPAPRLVVVGRRLGQKLAGDRRVVAELPGPAVFEELGGTLNALADTVRDQVARAELAHPLSLVLLFHVQENQGPSRVEVLQPIRNFGARAVTYETPPLLYLQPATFLAHFVDLYLFAVLHTVFYSSLAVENHRRLQQMQGALDRIDKRMRDWRVKLNLLRQEEITEEIEVILLSSEAMREQMGG